MMSAILLEQEREAHRLKSVISSTSDRLELEIGRAERAELRAEYAFKTSQADFKPSKQRECVQKQRKRDGGRKVRDGKAKRLNVSGNRSASELR